MIGILSSIIRPLIDNIFGRRKIEKDKKKDLVDILLAL